MHVEFDMLSKKLEVLRLDCAVLSSVPKGTAGSFNRSTAIYVNTGCSGSNAFGSRERD